MNACGIVAEFNPFHNGHEHIVNEAHRLCGCDAVVIAMSGNYVQRGAPAVTDKWTRCMMALKAGADLVIEIPTLFCLSDAGKYAHAGVMILESLGCVDKLCCGSESCDKETIREIATALKAMREKAICSINAMSKSGISYPAAREKLVLDFFRESGVSDNKLERARKVLTNPNDILAVEYAISSERAELILVKRQGAYHHDKDYAHAGIQSATVIRELLKLGDDESLNKAYTAVPEHCIETIASSKLTYKEQWRDVLKYAVLSTSATDIEDCPSGGEGLGNLLKEAVRSYDSFDDIILACKSKRYTYTRISRLCMQVILGISREEYSFEAPLYARILGFSERGRELLSEVKKNDSAVLPLITNINKELRDLEPDAKRLIALEEHATDVYNMVTGRDLRKDSDRVKSPIVLSEYIQ